MNPIFWRSDPQVGQSTSDKIGLQALKLQGLKAILMRGWVFDLEVGLPNPFLPAPFLQIRTMPEGRRRYSIREPQVMMAHPTRGGTLDQHSSRAAETRRGPDDAVRSGREHRNASGTRFYFRRDF